MKTHQQSPGQCPHKATFVDRAGAEVCRRCLATCSTVRPAMPTRRAYARAWKAWRKACRIRAAYRGNRAVKAWYDECRVMLARAERNHRRALSRG